MFTNQNRNAYLIVLSVVIAGSVIFPLPGIAATYNAEGLTPNGSRLKFTLNDNWRFYKGGCAGSEQMEFNDSTWQKINLPHTWNADDDLSTIEKYDRGTGWYRKMFTLPGDIASKRIYIYFEAANQVADVYLNGKRLGQHKGGYSGFVFDITDHVKRDLNNENLLAVKVNGSWDKDIPPLTEEAFAIYCGIYRDVWLIAADPVHIEMLDYASSGVYIDILSASRKEASVKIRSIVVNDSEKTASGFVLNTVKDTSGKPVATQKQSFSCAPGQSKHLADTVTIKNPHLWSPEEPYLYTVHTEIYIDDRIVDHVKNPFGVRWYKFDSNEGFFLNDEPYKLKGTSRHQDWAGYGNALENWMHVHDMKLVKQMGANFVRLGHYPQDDVILDTADELGLMVWEEIPITFYCGISEKFEKNAVAMLHEMIKQHYNHPSVIMWGYMNEVLLRNSKGERGDKAEDYVNAVVELGKRLDKLVHELDSTRPTVMAAHSSQIYDQCGLSDVPDILGWNRYDGWYGSSFEGFGKAMDKQHELFPDRVLVASEYGAGNDSRLHSLNPEKLDFVCEWQQMYHESYLKQIKERPYFCASAVWIQFDFGNIYSQDTMPGLNQKGLMNWDRTPKDVYYLYKANYSNEPVVYIASRDWKYRTGTNPDAVEGQGPSAVKQPVKVYCNLEAVELVANGKSLGTKHPDQSCVTIWDVDFVNGTNKLTAKGSNGKQLFEDNVEVHFTYQSPKLSDPSVPFKELAINVGATFQFIDESGLVWDADRPYKPGGWGHIGGSERVINAWAKKTEGTFATEEEPLYQRFLNGLESYRFDVPDGDYEVELKFAEYDAKEAGERVFSIKINGRGVIENLDIIRQYGYRTAFVRTFTASAQQGKGIVIDFNAAKGQSLLCAVRIKKI